MMSLVIKDNATVSWTWTPVEWHWWEVMKLILAITGIIGNILVMLVLFRVKRKLSSTDTLIAGLALADFMTSVFIIPHAQVKTLPDTMAAQLYCRIIHSSVFLWISICASIFTLTTISIERLIAVVFPFQFQRIFSPNRTIVMIASIWFVSLLVNIVVMFVVYFKDGSCEFGFPSIWFHRLTGVMVFLIEYLFPVTIMVVAHAFIIVILRRRPRKRNRRKTGEAKRRITGMFLLIVIVFIISWTPDQFFYFALNIGLIDVSYLYSPLYRSFVVLAFVNSCVNPMIYAARNPNFRQALKELFSSVRVVGDHHVFGIATKESQTGDSKTRGTNVELSSTVL